MILGLAAYLFLGLYVGSVIILVIVVFLLSRLHLGQLRTGSFSLALAVTLALSLFIAVIVFYAVPLILPYQLARPVQLFSIGLAIGNMPIMPAATIQWFNRA